MLLPITNALEVVCVYCIRTVTLCATVCDGVALLDPALSGTLVT